MKASLEQWWQTLVTRERVIVAVLAVLIVLVTFQSMLISPLYRGRDKALNSVDKQAELLQWMQERAALAAQLNNNTGISRVTSQHSISQRINATAKKAKITITRFQTSGENTVQVWLEDADFSALLLWLDTLQNKQGIHVDSIAITETNKPGLVAVRAALTTR